MLKIKHLFSLLFNKGYRKKHFCKHVWKKPFDSGYKQCEICFKILIK